MTLKLASDKRAKVWVNRQLVASEPSKAGHPASHWNLQTALKPGALVAGPNVIAVQVRGVMRPARLSGGLAGVVRAEPE